MRIQTVLIRTSLYLLWATMGETADRSGTFFDPTNTRDGQHIHTKDDCTNVQQSISDIFITIRKPLN